MSRANADWAEEAVASKLLQKYFIAILTTPTTYRPPPTPLRDRKNLFKCILSLGCCWFFYDCGLSVRLSVYLPVCLSVALTGSCSLQFVLRPASFIPQNRKETKTKCTPHASPATMFLRFALIFCTPVCVMCIWLSCLWLLRFRRSFQYLAFSHFPQSSHRGSWAGAEKFSTLRGAF